MHWTEYQISRATRCLWSLQEFDVGIEGLLLVNIDGLMVTTTMPATDSIQRVAAIATTMFLLGEEASDAWGDGDSTEMVIKLSPEEAGQSDTSGGHYVYMKPVGIDAVLVTVCQSDHLNNTLDANLDKAARFLQSLRINANEPSPRWFAPSQ
jgi:predicted regulator of Ras-like GTPase activity (Roadblock/LC7/MglB family)